MIKRILAGILAVMVAFATPTVNVAAQNVSAEQDYTNDVSWKTELAEGYEKTWDGAVSGDFGYDFYGSGVMITTYEGSGGAVTIPSTLAGYPVVGINDRAFLGENFTSVTISEGITSIGYSAFYNCTGLTSVSIPASMMSIGNSAFGGCSSLANISLSPSNVAYKVVNGVLFNSSGSELKAYPCGNGATSYTIPSSVSTICESAFDGAQKLNSITIPVNVTYIGDYAFAKSGLKEITIPGTVSEVRTYTCWQCMLEKVVIQSGVTDIGHYAFADNKWTLKTVTIPKSVTNIASYAFRENWLITDVYYEGNESEWNSYSGTKIWSYNDNLVNATIHYNSTMPGGGNGGNGGNGGTSGGGTTTLDQVESFVSRMYTVALDRTYDEGGLNTWATALKNGSHDGAGIAASFITGAEFKARGLSNSEYVDVLYKTFFDRAADASGKSLWVATLDGGQTREYVLSQFVNLDEFKILCESYGISRGIMFENGVASAPGIVKFVNRLYTTVLDRTPDTSGLYVWAFNLTLKTSTAKDAAKNFFGSQEYIMRNVDDATYISNLYTVFLDRSADADGLAVWITELRNGMSREKLLEIFADSAEFAIIAASYGL